MKINKIELIILKLPSNQGYLISFNYFPYFNRFYITSLLENLIYG